MKQMLGCHLNYPRPRKFLSKRDRMKKKKRHFLLSTKHFCKYAANTPEVHRGGVAGLKQDFWRSVPQRDDLQRQTDLSVTEGGGLNSSSQGVSGRHSPQKELLKSHGNTEIEEISNQDSLVTVQEMTSSPQPGTHLRFY